MIDEKIYTQEDLNNAVTKAIKDMSTVLEMLERRLKHLLESEFIRSFDEVNPTTKEYKLNISEADKERQKIVFVCDQNRCEECSSDVGLCQHTSDINHAKNFIKLDDGKWIEKFGGDHK